MSLKKTIMKYSLSNALKYDGKADLKSVIGKVFAAEPKLRKKGRDIVSQIYLAVKEVNKVNLELVWDPPWDKSMITEAGKLELNL